MAGRKVLVQDDGTGHQAYVEEGPTILLTGDATTTGHFFVGPDDPADTPAFLAILVAGDQWIDTTGGVPFQHKERNVANDGWDWSRMVAKDGAGAILTEANVTALAVGLYAGDFSVLLGADGQITLDNTEGSVKVAPDGAITLEVGEDGSSIFMDVDGAMSMTNAAAFSSINMAANGDVAIAAENIDLSPNTALTSNTSPIGTQAAAVADVVGSDPADIATTLNALLAAMRASNELAT